MHGQIYGKCSEIERKTEGKTETKSLNGKSMKKNGIPVWIRMAIEWLRCPGNRAIRKKIIFSEPVEYYGSSFDNIKRAAEFVISVPRHERRMLLKLILRDRSLFQYPETAGEILSFLK